METLSYASRRGDTAGWGSPDPGQIVLNVQRAVILMHGFVHAAMALVAVVGFIGLLVQSDLGVAASWLLGVVPLVLPLVAIGCFELYVSAERGPNRAGMTRVVTGVYAIIAALAFSSTVVWGFALPVKPCLALSYFSLGLLFHGSRELAIGIQAIMAVSAIVLVFAPGRKGLILAAPAWLLGWLLSHGIRAVIGAAYYIVHDLGAEPLGRWLAQRSGQQEGPSAGGEESSRAAAAGVSLAMAAGGSALAIMGAALAWLLLAFGRQAIPPILYPLLYLLIVDLVLLPLLPGASAIVIWIHRFVTTRGEPWIFVGSPLFVLLGPLAVLVLCWVALHRAALSGAKGIGRWQIGDAPAVLQGIVGAVWVHLAIWIFVTTLNAQTGLTLLGYEMPGIKLFERNTRTPVLKLPPELQARRDALLPFLYDMAVKNENVAAFQDYTRLTGENPDAKYTRFRELTEWTQRKLTGLPWYYSPAAFQLDKIARCVIFWGCLLLAIMTMIRWPGVHTVLPHVALRTGVFVIRLAAPTGLLAACLLGESPRPDRIALTAGLALVALAVMAVIYWLGWLISRDVGATRHYAPFMATRLLQKRRIAFFAIGAVTLCVAMVLIVISVMGGFLDLVRDRSRGLLGDLVMANNSLLGFAGYEEFIQRIKQLEDEDGKPIVREATPVIYTYGVLRFPVSKVTNMVRVVGVRMHESVNVTRFGESLNFEKYYPGTTHLGKQQQPYWGWGAEGIPRLPPKLEAARAEGLERIEDPEELEKYERLPGMDYPGPGDYLHYGGSDLSEAYDALRSVEAGLQILGEDAAAGNWAGTPQYESDLSHDDLAPVPVDPAARQANPASTGPSTASTEPAQGPDEDPPLVKRMLRMAEQVEEMIRKLERSPAPEAGRIAKQFEGLVGRMMDATDKIPEKDKSVCEDVNAMLGKLQGPIETLSKIRKRPGYSGAELYGVVLGRDLVATRQASGEYERYYPRGAVMTVSVLPLTTEGAFSRQGPVGLKLRYVDDSRMGVYDIDSVCVYMEFAQLQRIMDMGPLKLADGTGTTSPRASQVLIKLTEGRDVLLWKHKLLEEWERFARAWPHDRDWRPMARVEIKTWEEQQAQFIAAVQNEKILVTTLFAVISAVAIFLVVCIFYMIVTEKTRDIGILKSVGASSGGVAGVFLAYGAAIGLVGASLGLWIGTVFVHNINSIQDWIARLHPGLRIWSPEVYTFDVIPNTVKFEEAAVIFVVAILSSVLGATFPALRAGRTWPVEALRYE